jgi:phenylpropionate dioxygenase-like ring-hydroxylating dioxygenase large terminal subunit
VPANWKVWVENASECYHCPTSHTRSFSDALVDKADIYAGTTLVARFHRIVWESFTEILEEA